MDVADSIDNSLYLKKCLELETLFQTHFQHREQSKKILKERLSKAGLDVIHLRQSVAALTEELKAERSRCAALETSLGEAEKLHKAALVQRDIKVQQMECDIDARAQLLAFKSDECDRRLQSLQKQEEELLQRQQHLRAYQASLEVGIIPAQKQAEAERNRMRHAREEAEKFLEEAKASGEAAKRRKNDLESLYNLEMKCFDLEKKESASRMHILRQEIHATSYLISSRLAHVSVAETKAAERIRLNERDLSSKKDIIALKEKEMSSRHQREQQHILDEKERIRFTRELMHKDYRLILENVRLIGSKCSLEPEQSQVNKLKDLEKLLSSSLDDCHQYLEKKL
ncbi:hypothetical protein DQ04_12781010 [Trypanosoma grayi]|uniref:hypothetical protein n=1 Tax=Trypanosoma grayi TaxID=71804 RepID=UPI0004F412B8|nr:hypothetical protein DQ04_12781010 [Trypanosoma grayi]KEG06678.1 hypothetical protein DQ04_12781010 [Trypanosoma grayi]